MFLTRLLDAGETIIDESYIAKVVDNSKLEKISDKELLEILGKFFSELLKIQVEEFIVE